MADLYIQAIKLIHEAEGTREEGELAFDILPKAAEDFQEEIYQEYLDSLLGDIGTEFEDQEDICDAQRTLAMLKIKRQVHKAVNKMLTQMFVMNGVDPKVVTIKVRNSDLETSIRDDEMMMDIQPHQDGWELDNKMFQRTWCPDDRSGPPFFELSTGRADKTKRS
jgi:hypothetical protein